MLEVQKILPNNHENVTLTAALADFLSDIRNSQSHATERTYGYVLGRFYSYLASSAFATQHLSLVTSSSTEAESALSQLQPEKFPIAKLQTDWAISFMRLVAAGQLNATLDSTSASSNVRNTNIKVKQIPKSTVATHAAALLRFYRWCSVERLLTMPTDEFERLTIRLRELRGKQKRTIIDKVPADNLVEALLAQAKANLDTAIATKNNLATMQASKESVEGDLNTKDTSIASVEITKGLAKYDQIQHTLQSYRNLALLETLKSTGSRVSELCNLTRGDLDATNQRARVLGKGNKERWVYFSPASWEAIQKYLQVRTQLLAQVASNTLASNSEKKAETTTSKTLPENKGKKSKNIRVKLSELAAQPVFARHDRGAGMSQVKPLTPRSIQRMLWQLVEETELLAYITPHKFRHWFATKMLAATGDLAVTQDLLGHANPATTRIYAQVSETKKQDAHRQVFK
jgi:site-specific recombinase XerD